MEFDFEDVQLATKSPIKIDGDTYEFIHTKDRGIKARQSGSVFARKVICVRGIPIYVSDSSACDIQPETEFTRQS
jgi:hypothetical protein